MNIVTITFNESEGGLHAKFVNIVITDAVVRAPTIDQIKRSPTTYPAQPDGSHKR